MRWIGRLEVIDNGRNNLIPRVCRQKNASLVASALFARRTGVVGARVGRFAESEFEFSRPLVASAVFAEANLDFILSRSIAYDHSRCHPSERLRATRKPFG
jgi:hypothetical protein